MGWIKVEPIPHRCSHPVMTFNKGAGSIWQCDECKTYWQIRRWGGPNKDKYAEWDKLNIAPDVVLTETSRIAISPLFK